MSSSMNCYPRPRARAIARAQVARKNQTRQLQLLAAASWLGYVALLCSLAR
jgi:hypothetical protein